MKRMLIIGAIVAMSFLGVLLFLNARSGESPLVATSTNEEPVKETSNAKSPGADKGRTEVNLIKHVAPVQATHDGYELSASEMIAAKENLSDWILSLTRRQTALIKSRASREKLAENQWAIARLELAASKIKAGQFTLHSREGAQLIRGDGDPDAMAIPSTVVRDGVPIYLRVEVTEEERGNLSSVRDTYVDEEIASMEARLRKFNSLPLTKRIELVNGKRPVIPWRRMLESTLRFL